MLFYMMQSPDGDLIDCVLSHLQPAFDHPQLKGMNPLVLLLNNFQSFSFKQVCGTTFFWCVSFITHAMQEPPKRPQANDTVNEMEEILQLWTVSGESCPEGTVPIRRTTEKDVMRSSKLRRFGRKIRRGVRHDTLSSDHEVILIYFIVSFLTILVEWTIYRKQSL